MTDVSINLKQMHEIKISALKSLGYRNRRTFSELQGNLPSNKVSFHLNKLREAGIIEKEGDLYRMTEKGKSILADLKFRDFEMPIGVLLVIARNKDGEIYLEYNDDNMDPLAECYRPMVERMARSERARNKAENMVKKRLRVEPEKLDFAGILDMKTLFGEGRYQHYMNYILTTELDIQSDDFYSRDRLAEMNVIPGFERIVESSLNPEKAGFLANWDLQSTEKGFKLKELSL